MKQVTSKEIRQITAIEREGTLASGGGARPNRGNDAPKDQGEEGPYAKVMLRHEYYKNVYTEYFDKAVGQGTTPAAGPEGQGEENDEETPVAEPQRGKHKLFLLKTKSKHGPKDFAPRIHSLNSKQKLKPECCKDAQIIYIFDSHKYISEDMDNDKHLTKQTCKEKEFNTIYTYNNKRNSLYDDEKSIEKPYEMDVNQIEKLLSNEVMIKMKITESEFNDPDCPLERNIVNKVNFKNITKELASKDALNATKLHPSKQTGFSTKISQGTNNMPDYRRVFNKSSLGTLPNTNIVSCDMYNIQKPKSKNEINTISSVEVKCNSEENDDNYYYLVLDDEMSKVLQDGNVQLMPASQNIQKDIKTLKLGKLKSIPKHKQSSRIQDNYDYPHKELLLRTNDLCEDNLSNAFYGTRYEDLNNALSKGQMRKKRQFGKTFVVEQLTKNRKSEVSKQSVMQTHRHPKEDDLGAVLMVLPHHKHRDDVAEEYSDVGELEVKDSCHCERAAGVEWFEIHEIEDEEDIFLEEQKSSPRQKPGKNYPHLGLKRSESIICIDRECRQQKGKKNKSQLEEKHSPYKQKISKRINHNGTVQPSVCRNTTKFQRRDSPIHGHGRSNCDDSYDVTEPKACGRNSYCRQPLNNCSGKKETCSPYAQKLRKKSALKYAPCERPRTANCTSHRKHHDPSGRSNFPESLLMEPHHKEPFHPRMRKPTREPEYPCECGHHAGCSDSYSDVMFIPKNQGFRHSNQAHSLYSSSRTKFKPPHLDPVCSRQQMYCRKHLGREHSHHSHHSNNSLMRNRSSHSMRSIPSQGYANMCQHDWPDSRTSIYRVVPRRSVSACRQCLGERSHPGNFSKTYVHDLQDGYFLDPCWFEANRHNEDHFARKKTKYHEKPKKEYRKKTISNYGSLMGVNTLSVQVDTNDVTPIAKPRVKKNARNYIPLNQNQDKPFTFDLNIIDKQITDDLSTSEKQNKTIDYTEIETIKHPPVDNQNLPDDFSKYHFNADYKLSNISNEKQENNKEREKKQKLKQLTDDDRINVEKHINGAEIKSSIERYAIKKNGRYKTSYDIIAEPFNKLKKKVACSSQSLRRKFSRYNGAIRSHKVDPLKEKLLQSDSSIRRKHEDQTTQSRVGLESSDTRDECEITLTDFSSNENTEDTETTSSDLKRGSLTDSRLSQSHVDKILKELKIFDDNQCRYGDYITHDNSDAHDPLNAFKCSNYNERNASITRLVLNHAKRDVTSANNDISLPISRKSKTKTLNLGERYSSKPRNRTELDELRGELGTQDIVKPPFHYKPYERKGEKASSSMIGPNEEYSEILDKNYQLAVQNQCISQRCKSKKDGENKKVPRKNYNELRVDKLNTVTSRFFRLGQKTPCPIIDKTMKIPNTSYKKSRKISLQNTTTYDQTVESNGKKENCKKHDSVKELCKQVLEEVCLEKYPVDEFCHENVRSQISYDNIIDDNQNLFKVNKKRKYSKLRSKYEDDTQPPYLDVSHRRSSCDADNQINARTTKSKDLMSEDCKIFNNIFDEKSKTSSKFTSRIFQNKDSGQPKSKVKFWKQSIKKPDYTSPKSKCSTVNLQPDCQKLLDLLTQMYNNTKKHIRESIVQNIDGETISKCHIQQKCLIMDDGFNLNGIRPKPEADNCICNFPKHLLNDKPFTAIGYDCVKCGNVDNNRLPSIKSSVHKHLKSDKDCKQTKPNSLKCNNGDILNHFVCDKSESSGSQRSIKYPKEQDNRIKTAIRKCKSITAAKLKESCKSLSSSKTRNRKKTNGKLSKHSVRDSLCKIRETIRSKRSSKTSQKRYPSIASSKKSSKKNVSFSNVIDSITVCDTTNSPHKSSVDIFNGLCKNTMKAPSRTSITGILIYKRDFQPQLRTNSVRISTSCPNNYSRMAFTTPNDNGKDREVHSKVEGNDINVKSKRNLLKEIKKYSNVKMERTAPKHNIPFEKISSESNDIAKVSIIDEHRKGVAINRCDLESLRNTQIPKVLACRPVFFQGNPTNISAKKSNCEVVQKVESSNKNFKPEEIVRTCNAVKIAEESPSTELVAFCYTSTSSTDYSSTDAEHRNHTSSIDRNCFLTRTNSRSRDFEHKNQGNNPKFEPYVERNFRDKQTRSYTRKVHTGRITNENNLTGNNKTKEKFVKYGPIKKVNAALNLYDIKRAKPVLNISNHTMLALKVVPKSKPNSYESFAKFPQRNDTFDRETLPMFKDAYLRKGFDENDSVESYQLTILNSEGIQVSSGKVNCDIGNENKMIILCSEDQQT